MMKQYILIMLFTLAGLAGMAQTNEPLPSGAVQFSNQLWIVPSDSTIWTGDVFEGKYVNLGSWRKVDSLLALKADAADLADYYTQAQIDAFLALKADASALDDFYTKLEVDGLLGGYVPTSRTVNGKALTGNITLNADDVNALQAGDNVSDLVNDVPYLTSGDIPAPPVTSVNSLTGAVVITKADVGLGNVDNTSDANKPVSTAQQDALDLKEDAFTKGDVSAGTGISLSGNLTGRLVGSGGVTASFDSNWGDGRYALKSEIPSIPADYLSTNPQSTGGSVFNVNSGDMSSITNSGAFFATSGVSGRPWASTNGVLNIRGSSTSWFQLVFATSGTGFGSEEPWFNNRPGSQSYVQLAGKPWVTANFAPNSVFGRSANGLVPSPGGSGTTRFLSEDGTWKVPDGGGGGGTATDLSIQNRTSTTMDIGSSTGSAATVPIATTTLGGLMTGADKAKLDGLTTYSGGDGISVSGATVSADQSWFNSRYFPFSGGVLTGDLTVNNNLSISRGDNNFRMQVSGTGYSPYNRIYLGRGDNTTGLYYGSGYQIWHAGNFNPSNYLTTSYIPTWASISGKPSTFTPSAHTHNASDINAGTLAIGRIPTGTTGSTVALGNHTHSASAITSGTFNIARIPTGTSSSTVAIGNDSRINNGQTAYGWGNHASAGYAVSGTGSTQVRNNSQLDARYLQSSDLSGYVPTTRTINGKALSADVTLTAADIGAPSLVTSGSSSQGAVRYLGTSATGNGAWWGGSAMPNSAGVNLNYGGTLRAWAFDANQSVSALDVVYRGLKGGVTPISGTAIDMERSLQTVTISSNTTYTLSNNESGRSTTIRVHNDSANVNTVTITGAERIGTNSSISPNNYGIVEVVNWGDITTYEVRY